MTIKKGKLRGYESCGMLCSGVELGLTEDLYPGAGYNGLLVLPEDAELGADVDRNDVRAFFGEPDGVRTSLSACGSGDQCHLVVELSHDVRLLAHTSVKCADGVGYRVGEE